MIRRWYPIIVLYGGLIVLGWLISNHVTLILARNAEAGDTFHVVAMMGVVCVIYILASALPFVPGAEIGLGLIAVFGARVALLVYLCMICALSLSFLIGRLVPARWLSGVFSYLRLHKAAGLVQEFGKQPQEACEARLRQSTNNRFLLALLGYRYIALAVALNVPGNTVLGGGGGLALFAGMSRLFSPLRFFTMLLIAVAPIPLTVFVMGYQP